MKILHNGKAIIIGDEKLNLNDFPDLQIIGCPMTGTDHLPVDEIDSRGIKLITLREFPHFLKLITSTSEHTFGLIIAHLRNYKDALREPYENREFYKGHTLFGKTLGIIGLGRIGRQVKAVAEAFGMNVLTHDIHDVSTTPIFGKPKPTHNLEKLLRASDIVSIHVPLPGNEGFFTEAMFGFMKSSALLINTSRDKVIQKGALLEALEHGTIHGAAIDFIDDEDLREYALNHKNLLLTNHIGGVTYEDRARTEECIVNAVENFIKDNNI